MKPTLKLCSSHSATGISKTPDLVTSLEPVPLLFRARGTTRESLIEGAKQKHTQREGLCDLSIRSRGGGGHIELHLMGNGIAYLALNSISLLRLITHLLAHTCSSLLALKHQEIACVKHSFIIQVPVYCENRFIY